MRRTRYNGRWASGLEEKIITDLEKRNVQYEYEPRRIYYWRPVRKGRCDVCKSEHTSTLRRYTPDLRIGNSYIEIKGKLTPSIRGAIPFILRSPDMVGYDLRFIFQKDNWITKKHKSKYSDWARRLGIKYHIGESVPQEWLDGQD